MNKAFTLQVFALLIISSLLTGCAFNKPQPIYSPPSDIYEENHSMYLTADRTLHPLVNSKKRWKKIENEGDVATAIKILSDLIAEKHAPSMTLLAKYFLRHSDEIDLLSRNVKARLAIRTALKAAGKSEQDLRRDLASQKAVATSLLNEAARSGYPEAINKLKELKKPIPTVDQSTRSQLNALESYKAQLASWQTEKQDYEKRQADFGRSFAQALGAGLAAGLQAYTANRYPQQVAPADDSQVMALLARENYQGCCSYHGGIQRNYLGKAQCIFGKVVCNDGNLSPSCGCN